VNAAVSDADGEVMMSDWLDMVQKKNEFVREESELIYRLHTLITFILHCILNFVFINLEFSNFVAYIYF